MTRSARIDTPTARVKLTPRREPYWHKIQTAGYLGYRRTQTGGTWIARWRTPEGQEYNALGPLDSIDPKDQFDRAAELAREWFSSRGARPSSGAYTVKDCVNDYVRNRRKEKGEKAATDAEQRLYKHVVATLGDTRLDKLTLAQVEQWREGMVKDGDEDAVRRSKDTANRTLSIFKAALNLAWRRDLVGSDRAWRRVKAFQDVGEARKVFLTEKQAEALIHAAPPDFATLLRSALITGARYGELVEARVMDLDTQHGTLRLSGKTGARDCYLSDAGLSHFKSMTKGKLPGAYLHTREDGEPWLKSHQIRRMRAAVAAANKKGAKVPGDCTFYALRHTHISRALIAGVNVQVLAENTGTSVRMIEKHYGKFLKADRRAMFNKVAL